MIKKINFKAPLSVELLVTSRCNFNCSHCIFNSSNKCKTELSKKQIFRIIKELANMHVFYVGLNGGEPLLRKKDLYEIINEIRKKGMNFVITTNGVNLDKRFIKFISKKEIACIRITVTHTTKKSFEKFCGVRNVFYKVIKNISLCTKEDFRTVLLAPLYQGNIGEVDKLISLGKNLGVYAINFFPIVPLGRAKFMQDKGLLLEQKSYKNYLKMIVEKRGEITQPIILGDFPLEILVNKKLQSDQSNFLGQVCPGGVLTCVISWDGEVYPCPYFPKSVGNIFKKNLEEIWTKSHFMNLLRTTSRFKGSKCYSCKYLNMCRGGCPARTYSEYKNICMADPLCWYKSNVSD